MKTTAVAVAAALFSFIIGCIWVFVRAEMFVQYFYETRMVALAHVFTLGWMSLMIVGVLGQLAPAAFGLKLQRPQWIGAAVALWIAGLIAMASGFATLTYTVAAAGTSLLFLAILIVLYVLLNGFRGIQFEPSHRCLFAALLYLGAAATLGAWMGLAKGFDLALPAAFHRVLFAHIHLAGAGWAGLMIVAVMSRLFPQPHLRHPLQARIRFAAFNIGLSGLTAGLLFGGEWYAAFGLILALACLWYAAAFIPVLLEFGQPSDRSTAFLVTSWSCLAAAAAIGIWLCAAPGPPTPFRVQLQFAYGFVYIFGWVSFMILGMLYRIIPSHMSKFLASRGITKAGGLRRAFVDPDLQATVLVCLVLGLLVAGSGILAESVMVFRFGWALWLTGLIGFIAGLYRLARAIPGAVQGGAD